MKFGTDFSMDQERLAYSRRLEEAVGRIVDVLSSLEEVERISLFGSFARGRADLFTDLDILVVMDTDKGFLERLTFLYGLLAIPVDLDILCYTPKELESFKDRLFIRGILREEKVLYEKRRH